MGSLGPEWPAVSRIGGRMSDEPDAAGSSDRPVDRIAEAEDLVGTEALWRGQILHAGAELGAFAVLDADPTAASDVATELGLDRDYTYRLLRAMASFGVLDEEAGRRFSLTPLGELFQEDHPNSVRSDLLFNRSREWMRSMLHLPEVVEEGGPSGFVREFGCGFFEYAAEHPEFASHYNELMELASRAHPEQFLGALGGYDFSRFSLVCDVGGGRGHFLCHVLEAVPQLEGVVFDLPAVVESDSRWAPKLGVSDRCTYVGGDMFDDVPTADGYVLKWILHNWGDEDCRRILSTVHEAAPADGRLFVLESVVPGPEAAHDAKRLDVTMMTQVGGRERTEGEYATLLDRSDWTLEERYVPDDGTLNVLEAVKA